MKNLAEELADILAAQADLYEQVLALTEEERAALSDRKPDQVLLLGRRKETLLLQIKSLDESRGLICARMAAGWNVRRASLTIEQIRQRLAGSNEAILLGNARARLLDCVERLGNANSLNERICRTGMEVVRRIMEGLAKPRQSAPTGKTGNPWSAYGIATKSPVASSR